MRRWIVTALGQDRPGIVAGVTEVLYKLGCNLEDSAMTRLEGEFAIMLIFSSAAKVTEERLRDSFAKLERQGRLVVHLKSLNQRETSRPKKSGPTYLISVYGGDHPGIVFRVSEMLAKVGANITDVHTHRSTGDAPSLYLMLLEVEAPPRLSLETLEHQLHTLGKTLKVEVSVRPAETSIL